MALILIEEILEQATRVIYKCKRKACKHIWAIEYSHKRSRNLYRVADREQIWAQQDYCCPKCGNKLYVEANQVVGVYNEKRACNARCMGATNGACSCSCGGSNHGISFLG